MCMCVYHVRVCVCAWCLYVLVISLYALSPPFPRPHGLLTFDVTMCKALTRRGPSFRYWSTLTFESTGWGRSVWSTTTCKNPKNLYTLFSVVTGGNQCGAQLRV